MNVLLIHYLISFWDVDNTSNCISVSDICLNQAIMFTIIYPKIQRNITDFDNFKSHEMERPSIMIYCNNSIASATWIATTPDPPPKIALIRP